LTAVAIPVFSFVGRIVLQKGVHLILNAVHELLQTYQGKIQILVGGAANLSGMVHFSFYK
jgi:glycogen synthase